MTDEWGRVTPEDPVEFSGRDDSKTLDFWDCGDVPLPDLAGFVETQVYLAIRELLTRPFNPDFLLDWIYPAAVLGDEDVPVPDGWGIRLRVDGRRFKDIVVRLDFGELLKSELDDYRAWDRDKNAPGSGPLLLGRCDLRHLRALAERMGEAAEQLKKELEAAVIQEDET